MSTNAGGVSASNDGLGLEPEATLRQQSFLILSRLQSGTENVVRLDVALAAVAAARERCAKLIEPKNPPSDWTQLAQYAADLARRIRTEA